MNDFHDTHSVGEAGHLNVATQNESAGLVFPPQGGVTGHSSYVTHIDIAGHEISSQEDESGQGCHVAQPVPAALDNSASAEPGHCSPDVQTESAGLSHSGQPDGSDHNRDETLKSTVAADNSSVSPHCAADTHSRGGADRRFIDPQVMQIVQLHRLRRRWLKARNSLVLQGKAICRSFAAGDKVAGSKAFARVMDGKPTEADAFVEMALMPFIPAIQKFDAELTMIENQMVKLAKKLPIARWVNDVRGLGWASVAAIVGEAGDLSAYPTVSGVWKRLGLAVIDGGRQRRVANAEAALEHGYSAERRSVVWVMADSMAKHQRTWIDKETGEIKKAPGPYGVVLETEKAKALAKEWTPLHAENHAKRVMSKAVLRDLTLEWRKVAAQ